LKRISSPHPENILSLLETGPVRRLELIRLIVRGKIVSPVADQSLLGLRGYAVKVPIDEPLAREVELADAGGNVERRAAGRQIRLVATLEPGGRHDETRPRLDARLRHHVHREYLARVGAHSCKRIVQLNRWIAIVRMDAVRRPVPGSGIGQLETGD